jgi:hypothetical protein
MNMEQTTPKAATWIVVVSCLLALLGISISISMYVMPPDTFIPGLDPNSSAISYLNSMCAARQLSIATCIGFAGIKRSAPMLTISWLCYLLLNIQDGLIGVAQQDSGMIIGGIVISLLAVFVIFKLNRKNA